MSPYYQVQHIEKSQTVYFFPSNFTGLYFYISGEFSNFSRVALINDLYLISLAISSFFVQMQFLFILRYNQIIALMFATLNKAKSELSMMALLLVITIVAFGGPQLILIGSTDEDYSSIMHMFITQLSSALGVFKYKGTYTATGKLSKTFFLCYLLFAMIFVVNMFVTLLNLFISNLKSDESTQPKDHEVIEYMLNQMKEFVSPVTENAEYRSNGTYDFLYNRRLLGQSLQTITLYFRFLFRSIYLNIIYILKT